MNKFKELIERRNALVEKLDKVLKLVETEKRAMSAEEVTAFEQAQKEIKDIDKTLKLVEEARAIDPKKNVVSAAGKEQNEKEKASVNADLERRAFDSFLRNTALELRAGETAVNMTKSDNGAIIPKTIANKIIETVKNISPIYSMTTQFTVKGDLVFPVYDETTGKITCAYADEFKSLSANSGKFTSITLSGYLAGALAKVSLSLINNNDFDLVNYVITKIAEAVVEFLENQLLSGAADKMQGLIMSDNVLNSAASTVISSDDLINLESKVIQRYRANACWIMNPETYNALRKLKDAEGDYLLQRDLTKGFGYTLLGHPVYESDAMAKIAAGAFTIAFGDMSGLYSKLVENPSIQVLREKYADEHAIGVVAWIEVDSKIVEKQKIAIMKQAAA